MRNDDCILKELAKLTIAEIEEVKKRYKAMYPDDRRYCALCEIARNKKLSDIRRNDFMHVLAELKNAPDGAGTPSQGNVTQ